VSESVLHKAPLLRLAREGIATLEEVRRSWSFADVVDALEYLDLANDIRAIGAENTEG